MHIFKSSVLAILLIWSPPGYSLEDFRDAWRLIYPDSNSDDITGGEGCQLCHQSPAGNEPWNEYGWEVRQIYQITLDISEAIELAEGSPPTLTNHDNDSLGVSSLDEIRRSFQPGWTLGAVNTVYQANGTEIPNQPPPDVSGDPTTAIDFPAPIGNPIVGGIPTGAISVELDEMLTGLSAPLAAVTAPGINGSLFVVEQIGRIWRVDLASREKSLFLDVSNDLVTLSGGFDERGLLGLAFHPQYASNGLFYTYQSEPVRPEQNAAVDYSTLGAGTPNHRSMITEYQASNPSCNSHVLKRDVLLIIDQPQSNHNGGDLAFGEDGFLYIALGDGGGSSDVGAGHGLLGNGRDNTNPLGAILRIDTAGNNSANGKYGVPDDNPFVAGGDPGVDEIFAYGLRNPFRFSFDKGDSFGAGKGDLYAGDVGQGDLEEIDLIINGGNYGWNWKEGSFNFYSSASTGNYVSDVAPPGLPINLVEPIAQYDHDEGISVTGGYVYRGTQVPAMSGLYVFGDYAGRLLYLDLNSLTVSEFVVGAAIGGHITGFGQDSDNELYLITNSTVSPLDATGKLQRIVSLGGSSTPPDSGEETSVCPSEEDMCFPIKAANGKIAAICL